MTVIDKKIIFVGGKGGVGKSTSAAAIAMKSAQSGNKTMLVSTDPAHNVGDIFHMTIGGDTKKVTKNLYALEINPEIETGKYIQRVKENIKGIVHTQMIDEVNRHLDAAKASPGADEAALFDKVISIILGESESFDQLIFDTAPTGHTIRLLSLPELLGIWITGLLEKRKKTNENYSRLLYDGEPIEDPIYDVLKRRQERFREARNILLNHKMTAFIFVLNPEHLSIVETKKAIDLLANYQLDVKKLIVNKVLPENVDGNFFTERKRHEEVYLQRIAANFPNQEISYVPLFPHDITTKNHLEKIANMM